MPNQIQITHANDLKRPLHTSAFY